jgi:hypothetical protein
MKKSAHLLAVLALSQSGCGEGSGRASTEDQATRIANTHFSEVFPQVPLDILRMEVKSVGEKWVINYHPPKDSTGNGPFVVEVSKTTGEITEGLR